MCVKPVLKAIFRLPTSIAISVFCTWDSKFKFFVWYQRNYIWATKLFESFIHVQLPQLYVIELAWVELLSVSFLNLFLKGTSLTKLTRPLNMWHVFTASIFPCNRYVPIFYNTDTVSNVVTIHVSVRFSIILSSLSSQSLASRLAQLFSQKVSDFSAFFHCLYRLL